MAINSSTKLGVVYGTPSDFLSKIGTLTNTNGKLYVLHGESSGELTQGIYMVETNDNDPDGQANVQMLSSGAYASSTNAGLMSSELFDKLNNVNFNNYLLKSEYTIVDATKDGYVPKADGSDGIIDSSTKDWVLTYDSSSKSLGWYKLPTNAFLNDKGVTSITITQGDGITVTDSGTPISSTGARTISLNKATESSFGGIKVGYNTNDKNYKVELDNNGNAFVNVPWTDKPSDSSHSDSASKLDNKLNLQTDGSTIVEFNGETNKTFNIVSGTNVTIDKDATNGKITINANVSGALVYRGTVSTINDINSKNCTEDNKGDVYVASANFEGVITKNGVSTYKIEKGDMFICNGASWDIVNGEGQVTNGAITLEYAKNATLATVDGVDITITGPETPVTTFGSKTGAITLGSASASNDMTVNFVMNNNQLTATVPSLSNYVKSSTLNSYLTTSDASTTYLKINDANYFNTVKVGNVSIVADTSKDTLEFVAGDNITITSDATNDKITISANDTVYTHPVAGTGAIDTPSNTSVATTLLTRVKIDSSGHVTDTSAFNGTVGGTTTPIYFNAGVPTAMSYTIAKSVPSNAVFTDTMLTTAASTSKLYIVGKSDSSKNSTSTANYNANVYIDGNCLYSNSTKVATIDDVSTSKAEAIEAAAIYWELV